MTTTTSLPCCPNCGDSLPSPEETQAELSQAQARIAELEAQLHRINSVPTSHAQDTAPPDKQTRELLRALSREKLLRKEAEGRLTATSKEIEDLSVSLFEQANNMVADERRARAHLEERVGELEKRDVEKRRRLERLETALARIEHVRSLLDE
ncbi:unnamed protein product [Clonostachys rosea f. rosea IK726]|uniref:GDP/GTP exchange factor Sec2 N-terminal domain-containing protein n=2 Tax=Bionectria ochroleuca TaxID=29856 RepID=A0A0B7KE75_BIOOC|nr:unnamed protein product [Clonostachys rosea f. rosea IK726]